MSTKHAVYLATCVAVIAFAVGLALPAFVDVPVLWYRPAEREWLFAVHPPGIAMDFFGRCVLATSIAAVVTAVTYLFTRRIMRRDPAPVTLAMYGAWSIAFTLIAIAYFGWRLAHRTPVPPPVPSWYQPR